MFCLKTASMGAHNGPILVLDTRALIAPWTYSENAFSPTEVLDVDLCNSYGCHASKQGNSKDRELGLNYGSSKILLVCFHMIFLLQKNVLVKRVRPWVTSRQMS